MKCAFSWSSHFVVWIDMNISYLNWSEWLSYFRIFMNSFIDIIDEFVIFYALRLGAKKWVDIIIHTNFFHQRIKAHLQYLITQLLWRQNLNSVLKSWITPSNNISFTLNLLHYSKELKNWASKHSHRAFDCASKTIIHDKRISWSGTKLTKIARNVFLEINHLVLGLCGQREYRYL